MRLAFWTWVVDRLDGLRAHARNRKLQALSDSLVHGYNWQAKGHLIDKSLERQIERQRMAYAKHPIRSISGIELLKENDERKH